MSGNDSMSLDLWPYVEEAYRDELARITASCDEIIDLLQSDNFVDRAIRRFLDHEDRDGDRAIVERFLDDATTSRKEVLKLLEDISPEVPHRRYRKGISNGLA